MEYNTETSIQTIQKYSPIYFDIENKMKSNSQIIIAIDGCCGSGKSTLSNLLALEFDCNVFHMDDFFLPFELRTRERLQEPGGNVHFERVLNEVLLPLKNHRTVSYQPYNCSTGSLDERIYFESKQLNIIEGVYSLHPILQHAYDYRIFLTLDPTVQHDRILKRNGEKMLEKFLNEWIPMEELYFSAFKIHSICNVVINTSEY